MLGKWPLGKIPLATLDAFQVSSGKLTVPLVVNENAFYSATITHEVQHLTAPLVDNTTQFFGGAIHVGARQLLVGLVANDNEFFEHDIARTMGRLPIARGSLQRIAGASSTISRLPQQAGNLVRIDA